VDKINHEEVVKAESKLNRWITHNGLLGYDPFDLYSQVPLFRKIIYSKNKIKRLTISRLFSVSEMLFPLYLRKLFKVEKTINAKGVALLGLGYLMRFKNFGLQSDKDKVYELINWLWKNRCENHPGASWGYPFDWQSRIFIPKGTPSIVVSYTVGEFFLQAYECFKDGTLLDKANQITVFILNGLNRKEFPDGSCCFSYTPLDNFQVHNANLFAAAFLARIGAVNHEQEIIDLGVRAAKFALNEIKADGSLNYWGNEQDLNEGLNDHYHVGFEIRSLLEVGLLADNTDIIKAANRYYEYYCQNFFHPVKGKLTPKMYPDRPFPIDIHAVAESIILNTFLYLKEKKPSSLELANLSANWAIKNMQNASGSFAYTKFKLGLIEWNVRIPYLRWGQAWLFYALNFFLLTLKNENK